MADSKKDSELLMSRFVATTLRCVLRHFETAWLFTRSDFKTIIFPVMIFATVVSPRHNPLVLSCAFCWLWFHTFQFNASNQSYTANEDALNKPWRPVPSGRISLKDSRALRWGLVVFCLGFSSLFSLNVVITSGVYTVFVVMHDDFHLSHHPIFKNLCNVGGYVTCELGCSLILSRESSLDGTSMKALSCSALVILLTVHAQDFADVNGDRRSGRRTLPIAAPEGSRIYMLCALPLSSFALASFWSLGPISNILFVSMGSWVGIRYFLFHDEICDQSNYRLYSIWLMGVHFLPANVHFRALAW
ncbi:UbiA prenyltransferase family-domain-containing protein [Suillus subaureus]|uniref:UbiA prenyltransferase family-domain-containing protein n=1 Tax=Suillus subaureus TaxID=48587 RepID=A0A9P7EEW6_9AGAM|nr:UbiA prenyltransferase family-domain-containing protein [Suillus subaureus]KAG1819085.1 UbiA prenyltransferase family-domain-containing protein [Suillus subaureus]